MQILSNFSTIKYKGVNKMAFSVTIGKSKLTLVVGDITKQEVDAVVNAANSSLMGGGGVDGAIHRAAGPKLHEECLEIVKKQGECPTGEAVITSGGNMPAKYVIHTVGPIWHGGSSNEPELLAKCYENSLKLAIKNNIKTIAFPSISTGAYGYPVEKAAVVAIKSVKEFLENNDGIDEVIFVLFNDAIYKSYESVLKSLNL